MFRPLAFDYTDDAFATQVEDQLLLGNEIMIALNEVPLFIWEGKCIPVAEVAESVEQIDLSTLTMLGFDEVEYLLYDDDGVHKDYENEGTCRKIGK